jgi:uncharacterized membrane protein
VSSTITRTVDVAVPLRTAYDQWTQLEEFPRFMAGVSEVRQVDDRSTHWVVRFAGVKREFDAEVVVQRPDEGISWHSLTGPAHTGRVRFEPVADDVTRVELELTWEPQGLAEGLASSLHLVERRVETDLARFKEFVEQQGSATGAYRRTLDDASGPDTGTAPDVALAPSDVSGETGTARRVSAPPPAPPAGPPAPPARG